MLTESLIMVLLYLAGLALQCLIYTGLVWFMMRVQHLNYTVPKLLLATAIATAAAQIPWFGPYLSVVVLLLCLRRFTGEAIIPDLVFTVVVSGALMFAVNLWLLAALLPNAESLRESLAQPHPGPEESKEKALPVTVIDLDAAPPPTTTLPDGTMAPRQEPTVQGIVLKGVSISRQDQFVLVASGRKSYPLKAGEHVAFDTPQGPVDVQCESVESNRVWMQVRGPQRWERVELRFKSSGYLGGASSTGQVAQPAPAR